MLIPPADPYRDDGSSLYSVEFDDVYEAVTCANCLPSVLDTVEAWGQACCCAPDPQEWWLLRLYNRLLGRG